MISHLPRRDSAASLAPLLPNYSAQRPRTQTPPIIRTLTTARRSTYLPPATNAANESTCHANVSCDNNNANLRSYIIDAQSVHTPASATALRGAALGGSKWKA